MPDLGEQADVLRAVGRLLDDQQASHVEIENHEAFLTISWERYNGVAQQQYLQEVELESLRARARAMRQASNRGLDGSFAELLRTLGQELDRQGVEVSTIVEDREGFKVTGLLQGRYYRDTFRRGQLVTLSGQRRTRRGRGRPGLGTPPSRFG